MEIGRILGGRYKIVERIGSGGMSTVYKAHEVGLEREVAVKVLITALSSDPQLVERFNREARTIAGLQHNSIIPIYFYGIEEDFGTYLVMPLLKGGTLDQRLEQLTIRPSLTEVGELAERLGNALQYAHDKGIVHRDIKFSNIMFDDAGNPYLMDFGIAKMLGATNLTGTGMTVGTPQFMPPEQWRNDEITPAVDQYAFAILLYAMLTQRMPFDAPTPHALMYQHLQESPPLARDFRGDVPKEIEDALHKALSKDPADRFDSISQFTNIIASKALSSTREYSGFFKAPITIEKGQTNIGTSIHTPNAPQKMPNTPTEMVASSTAAGATTPSSNNRETKPPTQMNAEPVRESSSSDGNNTAFWGGMVAVLLIGVVIIAGLFVFTQSNNTLAPTEVLNAGLDETETVIAIEAQAESADATGTSVAQAVLTDEAVTETPLPTETPTNTATDNPTSTSTNTAEPTDTPIPTDTATATNTATAIPTYTPDATGTQLVIVLTDNANQQATDSAVLALTGTALSALATSQASDNATATGEAQNDIATAQANQNAANTATVQAVQNATQQAILNSTSEAIDINNTQQAVNLAQATVTAQALNINGTATEFANIQAQALTQQAIFNATQTQLAILANPTATATVIEVSGDEITYGQSIVDSGEGEPDIRFTFSGNQNDLISISARSADFDTLLELYRDGDLLIADDDGGMSLNSRISNYRLEQNAEYTIVLRTFSGDPITGEYVLGITEMLDCPSVLASRMLVGEYGRVTLDGGANRLRESPSTDGDIVTTIPEGDVFDVWAGPVCADGFAWYQVDYDGEVGWTAEGDDTEYYLELLPDTDPVILAGAQGLTNGADLAPGEFQVEYYCSRRGLSTRSDGIEWFCVNATDVPVITLVQSDFDQICRDTYDIDDAFALQDGDSTEPAFRWRCYYYPE